MADFNEVEDLRDWFIDTCAEFSAKVGTLNGDEPAGIIDRVHEKAEQMHSYGLEIIKCLDELLILKKKADYEA